MAYFDDRSLNQRHHRRFPAAYKLAILEEFDSCTEPADRSALLRRESLHGSNLDEWRGRRKTLRAEAKREAARPDLYPTVPTWPGLVDGEPRRAQSPPPQSFQIHTEEDDMTLEARIESVVERAVTKALEAHQAPPRISLSLQEAADSLGTSTTTVKKLVDEGHLTRLPHVGTRILIPVKSLEEFASRPVSE